MTSFHESSEEEYYGGRLQDPKVLGQLIIFQNDITCTEIISFGRE
jgi:hypothetical protein